MTFSSLIVVALLLGIWIWVRGLKWKLFRLEQRLQQLERQHAAAQRPETAAPSPQSATDAVPDAAVLAATVVAAAGVPGTDSPPPAPRRPPPLPVQAGDTAIASIAADAAGPASSAPSTAPLPRPTWWQRLGGQVREWFSSGNVPVKVGMLVLLAGVAALLKYLSDQGLLNTPIQLKLSAVAAAAVGMLGFGWRQRLRRPLFALALQGGAIGVLLLTVFAAFRLHGLIDALPALLASVVLVAGLCLLAVLQHSRTLAVLGILAGFMAPVWLSTGGGNHVALFSYYALLNLGVLAIAWWRPWRILNLLGFAFTFGIGTCWGVLDYRPEHYASTQPFVLLFFAFYLLIPLLYARRQPARAGDRIDGTLVFGTPLVAFGLQAALLTQAMPLALCALGVAAIYALLAWVFIGRAHYRALAQCWAVLAVGFATLAVPLALSASATASVFALEGAALVWLGLRQQRMLPQLSGGLLQLAAGFAWLLAASDAGGAGIAVLNPVFIGALLLALAGAASYLCCLRVRHALARPYYAWALGWLTLAVGWEIFHFIAADNRADAMLVQAVLSAWLAAEAWRRWQLPELRITALAGLLLLLPLMLLQAAAHQQPFAGWGGLAWAVVLVAGLRSLHCLRHGSGLISLLAQFAWWLLWATAVSLCLWVVVGATALGASWRALAAILPWLLLAGLLQWRWRWMVEPLQQAHGNGRSWLQGVVVVILGCWWLSALFAAGDARPLPWLPLLNPLELGLGAALVLPWLWLREHHRQWLPERVQTVLGAVAALLLLSTAALRAVHHLGGVAWSSVATSVPGQTSLTLLWSVLGMAGWIAGSRRGNRNLWLGGALLMAVVLIKLLLVDRNHLGNLLGIASFIGYGLLATVVGYFAPVPPRGIASARGEEQ